MIPTLGRLETLTRVLDHLAAQTLSGEAFEVVIAADTKAETVAEVDRLLAAQGYETRRVEGTIPGASGARNAGWRAARAPLVLFTDDDILAHPRLLQEHLAWHERHPERSVGVLGHVRWARDLKVTPFMRWLDHGIQFNYPSIRGEETAWGHFYTANVSVKRALVESVGGFDDRRLPYGYEDLDLALRMHERAGFRLLYNRAARAEHLQSMDLEFWKRRVARVAVAERSFLELHPEIPAYFHDLFSDAAARPPANGRTEPLARFIPGRVPLLGPYVWGRLDLFYRQALAGPFLHAWREAEASEHQRPVAQTP